MTLSLISSQYHGTDTNSAWTSAALTLAVNDVVVVKCGNQDQDSSGHAYVPTATGVTFTKVVEGVNASNGASSYSVAWWGIVTSAGSQAVTVTPTASSGTRFTTVIEQWRGAETTFTGGSHGTYNGGSAPSDSVSCTSGSVLSWLAADWNAVDGTSRTYRASATETGYVNVSGVYTCYGAYQSVSTTGSTTYGLTAPTGQLPSMVGIEIKPGSGSTPVSGTEAGTLASSDSTSATSSTSDSATLSESSSNSGTSPVATTDAGALAEVSSLQPSTSDSATLDDSTSDLTISDTTAEITLSSEVSSFGNTPISTTDAGTFADSSSSSATPAVADSFTFTDASSLTIQSTSPSSQDTLSFTDVSSLSTSLAVVTTDNAVLDDFSVLVEAALAHQSLGQVSIVYTPGVVVVEV